jgi:hypothetical protein
MKPAISDDDAAKLFSDTALALETLFEYPGAKAEELAQDYRRLFMDADYCASLGIPVQDEELFHHEGPFNLALRAHYYLGLKGDPKPDRFIDWRAKHRDLWQVWLDSRRK